MRAISQYPDERLRTRVLGINGTENRVKVTRVVQNPLCDRGTGKVPITPQPATIAGPL